VKLHNFFDDLPKLFSAEQQILGKVFPGEKHNPLKEESPIYEDGCSLHRLFLGQKKAQDCWAASNDCLRAVLSC
jgi:hypothetical protein